jgi:EAL domain-containing protein (putative c-di-GMP-specific phosphodiesterase class I)
VDDLNSAETLEEIVRLAERPEARGKIVFEILESEGIKNYENISLFIKKMQNKGIKIALDDFGTGYSNFDHILRLEVDYIKIDASLIKNIHRDRLSRSIVETILDLSKRLNVKSVAEYVHSSDVFLAVNELGIDYSQGYYIGEPSPDLVQEVNLRED